MKAMPEMAEAPIFHPFLRFPLMRTTHFAMISTIAIGMMVPFALAQETPQKEGVQVAVKDLAITYISLLPETSPAEKLKQQNNPFAPKRFFISLVFSSEQYPAIHPGLNRNIQLQCTDSNNKKWSVTAPTLTRYDNFTEPSLTLTADQLPSPGATWIHLKGSIPFVVAKDTKSTSIRGLQFGDKKKAGPLSLQMITKTRKESYIDSSPSDTYTIEFIKITAATAWPIQISTPDKNLDLSWVYPTENGSFSSHINFPEGHDKKAPIDVDIDYRTTETINVPIDFTITLGNATPQ